MAFDRARDIGLRSVPHAGETDGPGSIWAALDVLSADRIGHGVRAVEDPTLLRRLADEHVPPEVCPSSNVCTGVFATLADHSLPALLEAGIVVTVNSDDPTMFSTSLTDEYRRIAHTFDLDVRDIEQLMLNAVEASFLDPGDKTALAGQVTTEADRVTNVR